MQLIGKPASVFLRRGEGRFSAFAFRSSLFVFRGASSVFAPSLLRGRAWPYCRNMLRAMNSTLAGRSASRRMKYGYHSDPNGI